MVEKDGEPKTKKAIVYSGKLPGGAIVEYGSIEELVSLPAIKELTKGNFSGWCKSIDGTRLIATYEQGREWYMALAECGNLFDLPIWEALKPGMVI